MGAYAPFFLEVNMSKKIYEIIKTITILTAEGLKKKGDTFKENEVSEKKIKEFIKNGIITSEAGAKKMKEQADKLNKESKISFQEIKALETSVKKVQADLVAEKAEFAKEKAEFAKEKADLIKEISDLKKLK